MKITEIEENLKELVDNFTQEEFIYDLLLCYGIPKPTINRLKKGQRNLSKKFGQIIIKNKMLFQRAKKDDDLHTIIDDLKNDDDTYRHKPRFIIVTNYETLLAIDTKTEDALDIDILAIASNPSFFAPWAKIEKGNKTVEHPADRRAAENIAKIYDELKKNNNLIEKHDLHRLNVFLSRLLFCFFAEDTGIFEKGIFTNAITDRTNDDGSDLQEYLNKLFEVLNTEDRKNFPEHYHVFPYVNGGLFDDKYDAPIFSPKSRKMIIDCAIKINWKDINTDIFGSMFQSVIHQSKRDDYGMHYTSVPNIMKIIEPLFLNELKETYEKYIDNADKLKELLNRLRNLRIFDPACGSGNFLIIAYKEICDLERDILKQLQHLLKQSELPLSRISLTQFYGIEIDDFACEVALLSLWLTEHQMNIKFKDFFGDSKPTLPLQESGKIICGNAARINWEEVCPKDDNAEIYVLGNPPYLGSRNQKKEQKDDMEFLLGHIKRYKLLDYISCWFFQGGNYIRDCNIKLAFVSTNSICQGDQVGILWENILKDNVEIGFAYESFKWTNNAKNNAGVTCIIISLRNSSNDKKFLFVGPTRKEVPHINPYLKQTPTINVTRRTKPLSNLPIMLRGNDPIENGNLMLEPNEKDRLLNSHPEAEKFIKPTLGSREFINGIERYCLWIEDADVDEAMEIPEIKRRIDKVYQFRIERKSIATVKAARTPHKFIAVTHKNLPSIIVPVVSSGRREYIPTGFLDGSKIILNSAHAIYNADFSTFGIINSKMHLAWANAVSGKLKTDIRYSSRIIYNNFPLPELTDNQKEIISHYALGVIEERERYPEKTMAELYDPDKMPYGLRQAHEGLDAEVELCYRSATFANDEIRLKHLFDLYKKMTTEELINE